MDISLLIKQRLKDLGLEQKDLARAADITDSYVSQLLTRRKAPPAPGRTDIYERIGLALKLPSGELARLANLQRQEELRKKVADPAGPLFQECRELVLRKCAPESHAEIRHLFSKEPFGELERLVTQTLLEAAQSVAAVGLQSEEWQHQLALQQTTLAPLNGRSYEQMRVAMLEFLDTDVFHISVENCVSFLDPIIGGWDIELRTFAMDVSLNPTLASDTRKRFAFCEQISPQPSAPEPGFEQFLKDSSLSGDATEEEVMFLRTLKTGGRRPSPLYYYRELQNLRDPLHFLPDSQ